MKAEDLYEGMEEIDDDVLDRSEKNKEKKRRRKPLWIVGTAAVLAAAVLGGVWFRTWNRSWVLKAYAIEEASYPEMAHYPNEYSLTFDKDYDAWRESQKALQQEPGYADGLEPFFAAGIRQFLSGEPGENRACSPLNVYFALGMLAELTDGNSRQQILDLLGADSIESLRTQAQAVWKAHYCNDGATTSILASSLWLDEDVAFTPSTMETLAETYYASSYRGEMGSEELNEALRTWLNTQTGGLLEEQAQDIALTDEMIMALATTIYFQAKWDSEFNESKTTEETFHAADGDITCDFMHSSADGAYYWADQFGAVGRRLENGGGSMWFLLPDEGVTVEELLEDPQTMDFILSDGGWENGKRLIVNLSLPKFDITSQKDLAEDLQTLGITDVFDAVKSDFSPMTPGAKEIFVSTVQHDVRVAIDEEGVTAAAYTVMAMSGAGAPPDDEIDFVLDRPFLFALTSPDGLPLFVGIVHQPVH